MNAQNAACGTQCFGFVAEQAEETCARGLPPFSIRSARYFGVRADGWRAHGSVRPALRRNMTRLGMRHGIVERAATYVPRAHELLREANMLKRELARGVIARGEMTARRLRALQRERGISDDRRRARAATRARRAAAHRTHARVRSNRARTPTSETITGLPSATASSTTVIPETCEFGRSGTTITSAQSYSSRAAFRPNAGAIFTLLACSAFDTRRRVAIRTS